MQRFASQAATAIDAMQAAAAPAAASPADASSAGASSAAAAATEAANSLRQLLALAACVLPLLDAAAASRLPSSHQHLRTLLDVLRQAVEAAAAVDGASTVAGAAPSSPAVAPAALTAELAGHVARLAALAPAAAAAAAAVAESGGSSSGSQPEQQQAAASGEEAASAFESLQLGEQPSADAGDQQGRQIAQGQMQQGNTAAPAAPPTAQLVDSLQQLFAGVAAFAASAAGMPDVLAQPAAVLALLAATRSWVQMLLSQSVPLSPAADLLLPHGGSGWLLALRAYGNRDVILQAAQLLLLLLQHTPAALPALLDDTERQLLQLRADGSGEAAGAAGEPASVAAALRFNLQLLQAAATQLPPSSLGAAWQRLLPLAQPQTPLAVVPAEQPDQAPHRLWLLLLRLLQTTAERLAAGRQPAASGLQQEWLALLASLLSQHASAPDAVLLIALECLEHSAAWPAPAAEAGSLEEDGSTARSGEDPVAAALQAALACCDAPSAAVRAAALTAARAWVDGERGSCLLLRDAATAAAIYRAALLHLSDLHPPAAAAAEQLLVAAAAPLALSGALAGTSAGDSSAGAAAAGAAATALQRQQLGFRPAQLQQWLGYLEGGDGPAAVLTPAGQRAAPPLQQWLPRLLHSMQAVPPPGSESRGVSSTDVPW